MSSYDEEGYEEKKRRKHKRREEHSKHRQQYERHKRDEEASSDSDCDTGHTRKKHKRKTNESDMISRHHRKGSSGSDHSPARVKQEPSDDEYDRRRREKHRKPEPPVRIKEEPSSDTERNDRHRRRHGDNQRRDERRNRNGRRDENRYREERRANDEKRMQNRQAKRSKWQNSPEDENMQFGNPDSQPEGADDQANAKDKEKPNFSLSGKLTEDTNTYKGVVIKYSEPPEARKPKRRWRLYPFKEDKPLPVLHIHRQSAYLLGRERKIADIPLDHPSCSKQHAVFQYRLVPYTRDDGSKGHRICPYIIDLESANGTYVNNEKIDAKRYVQLMERDVLKFGFSSREYVLLHDNSDTTELQDEAVE